MRRLALLLGRIGIALLVSGLVIYGLSLVEITVSSGFSSMSGELSPDMAVIRPFYALSGGRVRVTVFSDSQDIEVYVLKISPEAFRVLGRFIENITMEERVIDVGLARLILNEATRTGYVSIVGQWRGSGSTTVEPESDSYYAILMMTTSITPVRYGVSLQNLVAMIPKRNAIPVALNMVALGLPLSLLYAFRSKRVYRMIAGRG